MRPNAKALRGTAVLDAYASNLIAVAYASSVALDLSLHDTFDVAALTADMQITFVNARAGQRGTVMVQQDGTGTRRVTFVDPVGFPIYQSGALTAAQAAGAITEFRYEVRSSVLFIDTVSRARAPNLVVSGGMQVVSGANRVITA